MRLEDIDVATFVSAVRLYLAEAWGDRAESHWPAMDFDRPELGDVLEQLVDERKNGGMRRFSLRLGNRRYPFMKMVFQESLVRNSFFFCVDTHDELDIKETTPDYAEWVAIREYNVGVKEAVENKWRSEDVPTLADVLSSVEQATVPDEEIRATGRPPLVFVVEDDRDIARGVRVILERRGYVPELFENAEDALVALKTRRPDLVLSDLELGSGANGLELGHKVRNLGGERIPFILATAASIDIGEHDDIDGFLVKPYEISILLHFLSKHLG